VKRSDGQFERRKNDFYSTWDPRAVAALLPHLPPQTRFCEPCAGDGALLDQLTAAGHVCARARDIAPGRNDIEQKDALTTITGNIDCFITNPPWTRAILHPLIVHLSDQAPTWLLFDADWKHTKQAAPFLPRLRKIVSVGRLKWIQGSKCDGKDNCAWYLFDRPGNALPEFIGRAA
jgi:hypothetical protein